jgi:outer membrane protein TolC
MQIKETGHTFLVAIARLSVVTIFVILLAARTAGAQNWAASSSIASEASAIGTTQSPLTGPASSIRIRRVTLEQVKQAADPITSPLQRLGQLSIEAARQHRLGVQADYFPKFSSMFVNLHTTDFLGQVVAIHRPIVGTTTQVPLAVLNQNTTIAALTFTQPITPLFMVYQAVKIARADEQIAIAKSGVSVARSKRKTEIEEIYLKLLIAQRRLISAEWKLKNRENRTQYASTSITLKQTLDDRPDVVRQEQLLKTAGAEVKTLTASLNSAMGWPVETELELVPPEPLVESLSLEEVSDKSAAANADVIEAKQNVVKARAASAISKLEYVPTVAAVSGYLFQNLIPSVRSNFGYGGVMASYNLFDFGKRERAVSEVRAKVEMAEIAVQLTKTKIAADVKQSYFELERSRQLSQMAQKFGSSLTLLTNVSSNSESGDVRAARAEVEGEMLEADLAHRQAFAHLRTLMGQ